MGKLNGCITNINYANGTLSGTVTNNNLDTETTLILRLNNITYAQKSQREENFIFDGIDFDKAYKIEVIAKQSDVETRLYPEGASTTLLLARQRTGTNVFRKFLNSHPDIFAINEIFDSGIYNNKDYQVYDQMYKMIKDKKTDLIGSFFPYHYKIIDAIKKPISYKNIFIEFLNYINMHSMQKHNIIDIKYNHIHNMSNFVMPVLSSKNNIFNIIKTNKYNVINLVRTNYLKSFVSGQLAGKSGNFVLSKDSTKNEHENIKLNIDINQLKYSMNIMFQEDAFVEENLKNYENYIKIEYADMFDECGNFNPKLIDRIGAFFKVDDLFNKSPLLKKLQNRKLEDIIMNYDEVVNALKNTQFEYCISQKQ